MFKSGQASEAGKKGGLIRGALQKSSSVENYNRDPKICIECRKPIPLNPKYSVAWTRQKKTCDYRCSALRNSKIRASIGQKKLLSECTKEEVFGRSDGKGWWHARVRIREHAYRLFIHSKLPLVCVHCGYDKHAEVCHKRPVSDFPGTALISEINDLSNLVALCPNHHWELDNGLLKLQSPA